MSNKKTPTTIVVKNMPPELPDYTGSDWFNILLDIDKPVFDKPEQSDNEWWQSHMLEHCFVGYAGTTELEELLTYWTNKRDEIVDKMEKGNWSSKSVTGLKMSTDIIKYDRACLIAIKKYREHQKLCIELAEQEGSPPPKRHELPSVVKRYEPHFGFPVMNKVLGDLLTSNVSKRISLKDEDMAEILKKDQGKVKVARCPKTPWKDITIVFLKENEFHVKYDGNTDIINPDCKNKLLNRSGEFSEEYTTLIKFAVNKGIIKAENAKVTVSKKNVSRLIDWLKEYPGREDDPIKWYKVQGYVCQFNVQFPSWNRKEVKQRDQDNFDDWQDANDKWKYIKEY